MDWGSLYREDPAPDRSASGALRVLWRVERRKEFRVQIITAAIYRHPAGQELRVFIEPEEKNDLLSSSVERVDFAPLEAKAADLRDVLLERAGRTLPNRGSERHGKAEIRDAKTETVEL